MNVDYDLPGGKGLRLVGTLSVNVRPAPPPPPSAGRPADNVAKSGEKPAEKGANSTGGDAKPDGKDPPPAKDNQAQPEKKS
jgi:hypothetical protein